MIINQLFKIGKQAVTTDKDSAMLAFALKDVIAKGEITVVAKSEQVDKISIERFCEMFSLH